MLERIIMIVAAVLVLYAVCRMIFRQWLSSENKLPAEELTNLGFWEKAAFRFDHFCEKLNRTKDFRKIRLEENFGSYPDENIR